MAEKVVAPGMDCVFCGCPARAHRRFFLGGPRGIAGIRCVRCAKRSGAKRVVCLQWPTNRTRAPRPHEVEVAMEVMP